MRLAQIVVLGIVVAVLVIGYLGYRQSHPRLINECNTDSDCGPLSGKVCRQSSVAMSMMAIADEHEGLGKWCINPRKCEKDQDCSVDSSLVGCQRIEDAGVPFFCQKDACVFNSDCLPPTVCIAPISGWSGYGSCELPKSAEGKCAASGGEWTQVCITQEWMCVHKTQDAGEECNSGSQCSTRRCTLDTGGLIALPPRGTEVSGNCVSDTNPCGCFPRIEDGKYEGMMCVD